MIVKQYPSIWELLFTLNGSIVAAIAPKILFVCVFSSAVTFFQEGVTMKDDALNYEMEFSPFAALGVALSLFLGFRNNACYDRW